MGSNGLQFLSANIRSGGILLVAPWIRTAIQATGGFLPLLRSGQSLPGPSRKLAGVLDGDIYHGKVSGTLGFRAALGFTEGGIVGITDFGLVDIVVGQVDPFLVLPEQKHPL